MSDDNPARITNRLLEAAIGCLVLIAVGGIGLVVILSLAARLYPVEIGHSVTAEEANQKLWINFVPASATDVHFYSSRSSTRIDCKLDAADFQAWCQQNGWRPTAIVAGEARPAYSQSLTRMIFVDSGFAFSPQAGDVGSRASLGVYDAKTGRAYVSYRGK